MKRFIIALIPFLLLSFWGCAKANDVRVPVSFYYCTDPVIYNSSEAVLSAEIRDGDGYGEDSVALLNLYLKGPVSDGFRSPFPNGTAVEHFELNDDLATVTLSNAFSELTDYNLTVACAGISMTVMELTGCENVQIQVKDALVGGLEYIEMNRQSLLFQDVYKPESTD